MDGTDVQNLSIIAFIRDPGGREDMMRFIVEDLERLHRCRWEELDEATQRRYAEAYTRRMFCLQTGSDPEGNFEIEVDLPQFTYEVVLTATYVRFVQAGSRKDAVSLVRAKAESEIFPEWQVTEVERRHLG